MYTPEYTRKLVNFCAMLEQAQVTRMKQQFPNTPFLHNQLVEVNDGRVYSRITIEKGARYFVRVKDGAIFASKSFKTPTLARQYGTLDTIEQFDWSGYNAVALPNSNFTMRMTDGHYMTAVPK
jgi:hypothetical protein